MLNEDHYFDREQFLDDVLKTDPEFSLPNDFADNMEKIVGRKMVWQNYVSEFLIYLSAIVGIAAILTAMAFIWFKADWKAWLTFFTGNYTLIIGVIFMVVFVLFTDRVLLRYFLHKS